VQLYHDSHALGPKYSFDWSVSAMGMVMPRPDNRKLTWFKIWVAKMFVVSLQPKAIKSETEEESGRLNNDGTNFASWYRYLSQEHQAEILTLTEQLRKTISGFYAFNLEQAGTHRVLKVGFSNEDINGVPTYFDFEQLSDGQRVMLVLYSLLLGLQGRGHTIFLDEPENYISLPEIQPWLMMLKDICEDGLLQVVVISHHPELIDYLGSECGKLMEREPLGPTRIKELPKQIDAGLKLSEQIARGWIE